MERLQALTYFRESKFDTLDVEKFDTQNKNGKILSLITNAKRRCKEASSENQKWEEIESHENFGRIHYYLGIWREPRMHLWKGHTDDLGECLLASDLREIIETYKKENLIINLDINNLYVTEYTPHDSIKLLHQIVDIGKEIFKDARPSNVSEEKAIDTYFRSKTRTIHYKEL
jgi:hypothetical protein